MFVSSAQVRLACFKQIILQIGNAVNIRNTKNKTVFKRRLLICKVFLAVTFKTRKLVLKNARLPFAKNLFLWYDTYSTVSNVGGNFCVSVNNLLYEASAKALLSDDVFY